MPKEFDNLIPKRIVRSKELCEILSISRSTAWRWQRDGDLPPSTSFGPNVKGWRLDVIEAWFANHAPPGKEQP